MPTGEIIMKSKETHLWLVPTAVFLIVSCIGIGITLVTENISYVIGGGLIAIFIAWSIKIPAEWERMVVLRVGRFRKIGGPGLFFIIPIIDTVPYCLSLRIFPYDVPKQKTLTNDNVPVTVDAVAYYRVKDPKAAAIKVENYKKATQWAATCILRDIIGKSSLDEVLAQREKLGEAITEKLDIMTNEWGIKVSHMEIRDVIISENLEAAIAREPAAEREKRARLKLAEAEKLAAETFRVAAQTYKKEPMAMKLRTMNMLFEMCVEGRSTVIFVPTETQMGMPTPLGIYGISDKLTTLMKEAQEKKVSKDSEEEEE